MGKKPEAFAALLFIAKLLLRFTCSEEDTRKFNDQIVCLFWYYGRTGHFGGKYWGSFLLW
jgi:hypothetical protein